MSKLKKVTCKHCQTIDVSYMTRIYCWYCKARYGEES